MFYNIFKNTGIFLYRIESFAFRIRKKYVSIMTFYSHIYDIQVDVTVHLLLHLNEIASSTTEDVQMKRNMLNTFASMTSVYSKKLPVFVRPPSAVQPPFDIQCITSSGHWATLGNQLSGPTGETVSLSVLCAATKRRPRRSNLHRHHSLMVPIHTLIEWSLGDLFLVPREIHFRAVQNSNQRSIDLQSNALQLDQRAPILKCSFVQQDYERNIFDIEPYQNILSKT